MTAPDLLAEVRAATAAKAQAEAQWLAACRVAYDAGLDRTEIARVAGFSRRDGLYQLLRRDRLRLNDEKRLTSTPEWGQR